MTKKEIWRDSECTGRAMCSYHAAGGEDSECGYLTPEEWAEAQAELDAETAVAE